MTWVVISFLCQFSYAQEISLHRIDSAWYKDIDRTYLPDPIWCSSGNTGRFRIKYETVVQQLDDSRYDTITSSTEDLTDEELEKYLKEYNKKHQKELDDKWDELDGDREDIRDLCQEEVDRYVRYRWNNKDFAICRDDCEGELEDCFTAGQMKYLTEVVTAYRWMLDDYDVIGINEDPPFSIEMELNLFIVYEALIWFEVSCFCQDPPNVVSILPEDTPDNVLNTPTAPTVLSLRYSGRTTGHVLTLTVQNTNDSDVVTEGQLAYVPSDGKYQDYLVLIPDGVLIPKGTTVDIPANGYCVDASTPPGPNGSIYQDVNACIPVESSIPYSRSPYLPQTDQPVKLLSRSSLPPFREADITDLMNHPAYKPDHTSVHTNIEPGGFHKPYATWPGTTKAIGGNIDFTSDPVTFAPLISSIVERIEKAYPEVGALKVYSDPKESVPTLKTGFIVQEAIWLSTSLLMGQDYGKDKFSDALQRQLHPGDNNINQSDVDQLWEVIVQTGIEAQVLSVSRQAPPILIQNRAKCAFDADTLTLEYSRGQNNEDQIEQQANAKKDGTCMYETARLYFQWTMKEECTCDENRGECDGNIPVKLEFKIADLGSGNPSEYRLYLMPTPAPGDRFILTDREGAVTTRKLSPGPNLQFPLSTEERFTEEDFTFRKRQGVYTVTAITNIPCKPGEYAIRYLLRKPPAGGLRFAKHDYTKGLNFIIEAQIKLSGDACEINKPEIKAYATEFRTEWDPQPINYFNGRSYIPLDPKDELAEVRVNGKTYYSLLKLTKENGNTVADPYPEKKRGVRRGE